ncbi:hypothetical protein STEG23_032756, partial [Scotinomys teguina]
SEYNLWVKFKYRARRPSPHQKGYCCFAELSVLADDSTFAESLSSGEETGFEHKDAAVIASSPRKGLFLRTPLPYPVWVSTYRFSNSKQWEPQPSKERLLEDKPSPKSNTISHLTASTFLFIKSNGIECLQSHKEKHYFTHLGYYDFIEEA